MGQGGGWDCAPPRRWLTGDRVEFPHGVALDANAETTKACAFGIAAAVGKGGVLEIRMSQKAKGEINTHMDITIGSELGRRYKVLALIERDVFTQDWLVLDSNLNKCWKMRTGLNSNEPSHSNANELIRVEAELLNKMSHPCIPRVIDCFDFGTTTCSVMDYHEGQNLQEKVRENGPLSPEQTISIAKQLCDVLGYLHNLNPPVIYGDLKPENIVLQPDEKIVLKSFIVTKTFSHEETGRAKGTLPFTPPEQIAGKIEPASDFYSFGITLYVLLTGRLPQFHSRKDPSLPKEFEPILLKCTRTNPKERYRSCEELLRDLEGIKKRTAKKGLFGRMASQTDDNRNTKSATEKTSESQLLRLYDCSAGHEITILGEQITVGRSPTSRLVINDRMISAKHALFRFDGMKWLLADNSSSNGTFLNGTKLQPFAPQPLREGDVIKFAESSFVFGGEAAYIKLQRSKDKRSDNGKNAELNQALNQVYPGLTMFVRDTDLPGRLAAKYVSGEIIREKAFVDASSRIGGMVTTHRYFILSNHMGNLSAFEHETNWGLHVTQMDSHFKVLGTLSSQGKTAIVLLHLPNDESWRLFQNVVVDLDQQILEMVKNRFEKAVSSKAIPELSTEAWLDRCRFPVGMREDGELWELE